ncbi:MAG: NADH-quinone oxidoreductase subunit NuoH [Chloroflexi bacterium]|uniref:NADH-quinone oxidoreductase subunit H n=1 Tax=Candidatus Chlorohelix allophototropha TaxID=3003348 RepID=A0A8T7LS49_9CHLR|nr:NADH-quinone oxidoreductase subunit NuoH [Chloroflexota bacterium]WJW66710.1 NADH-quinone oxidoreductase subunit NuoH [Chloroflexota bacterium L227-S17]
MFSLALFDVVNATAAKVNAPEEPVIWFLQTFVTLFIIMNVVLVIMAYQTWAERKVMALSQQRLGPMRTGPIGLLQPIADAVKLLNKEYIVPRDADKTLFFFAPIIGFIPAVAAFAVIPWGDATSEGLLGGWLRPIIANLNMGILYLLALSSIGVYGIVMSGYTSGNKYATLGSIRSSAQVVSYELTLGLGLMGTLIMAGSLNLNDVVLAQKNTMWYIIPQFFGFVVYAISGIAETNRNPFDLPEAESELVAGYHLEYGAMHFGMVYLGEYINMNVIAATVATLYLGGWAAPASFLEFIPGPIWLFLKFGLFLFLYYWIRVTLPRFRYDQLMGFCWKVLFPIALANVAITAIFKYLGITFGWWG